MGRARGFTLIELVIVIIVVSIMAAVLTPMTLSSLLAYNTTQADLVVLDKLRYATERLAREIREVNYNSSNGFAFAAPVGATCTAGTLGMCPNTMIFTRTFLDASGTASTATVTISNTGSAVKLAYSTPTVAAQTLTDELNGTTGLSFTYLTSDGVTTTTDPKLVRSVQISLTLRHNGSNYTQRTRVELKNIT
ncbi:MAG: prepilin-type N-terminal cleavage/methylation domain-containing protein [Rhodocyclaceae bacterium]|nr:MAG: prepilin-type N-terminal cleavage/methylation domain-containing protein [Rhodocyclaceae bacterium]